jgi:hypothetical protein
MKKRPKARRTARGANKKLTSKPKATAVPTPEGLILPRVMEEHPEPQEAWRRASRRASPPPPAQPEAGICQSCRTSPCSCLPLVQGSDLPDPIELQDPVGELFAEQASQFPETAVELDAAAASALDVMLREMAARQERGAWTERDARDMAKIAAALKEPAKRGRKKEHETLLRAHGIAWLLVHEPELRGRALAKRCGMTVDALRYFRDQNQTQIERGIELLTARKF